MSDVLTPHPSEQTHPPVDSLATAALVPGIFSLLCSLVCLGILLGPAAAIMGFMARGRVAASGGTVRGNPRPWRAWGWGPSAWWQASRGSCSS
jgi:hypothetical protein